MCATSKEALVRTKETATSVDDSTSVSLKMDGTSAPEANEGTKQDGRSNGIRTVEGSDKVPYSNQTREPHDNDVLCGRGGLMNNHPGNENFRQVVDKRRRVYLTARFKLEKRLVASSIVSEIRNLDPPGRFLSWDPVTGIWFDIGDEKARDKTSQALREKARVIRAEMKTVNNKVRAEMKRKRDADLEDEKKTEETSQILEKNAPTICAEMELEKNKAQAEAMPTQGEGASVGIAAGAQRHHHHPPAGPPPMHWGHQPGRHHHPHDPYVAGPRYPEDYRQDYESRWSPSPAETHHHQKPFHPSGSAPQHRRVAAPPHGGYRGCHGDQLQTQPYSSPPSQVSPDGSKSPFPPSAGAFAKSTFSFPARALSPKQVRGPSNHPPLPAEVGASKPIMPQHHPPPCFDRDSGGRRWVHFESPDDERHRSKAARRHYHKSSSCDEMRPNKISRMHYHRSHSYEDMSNATNGWEHEHRGREWFSGESVRHRTGGRFHDEHPGPYRHDQSLEQQRERQRACFSPLTVSRQNIVSPLGDDARNHHQSLEQNQQQHDPPSAVPRYGYPSQRPVDPQHQRPLSPAYTTTNYFYCLESEEPALDPLLLWCGEGLGGPPTALP